MKAIIEREHMEPGDVKGITLKMEDGTIKEVNKGLVLQLIGDDMHVDLLHFAPLDIIRAGVGIISTIQQMGLQVEFEKLFAYYAGLATDQEEE